MDRRYDFSLGYQVLHKTELPLGNPVEGERDSGVNPRRMWGFCARSRNFRRDYFSFCWQKR
jgi:hypothetical protein